MTEQQAYTVIQKFPDFEIREYPEHIRAVVDVRGDFMEAGNRAFYPLVRYISGNNAAEQKISMTAPVIQKSVSDNEHAVSFVLPRDMDMSQVPHPRDSHIQLKSIPVHRAAARIFSGSWKERRFEENAEALLAAVKKQGLGTTGDVYYARFDPPWKPGFMKHNEAIIALAE